MTAPEMIHLSPEELAIRWFMKPGTLSKWRQRGCGPRFISFGRRILYPMPEVESFESAKLRLAVHVPVVKK